MKRVFAAGLAIAGGLSAQFAGSGGGGSATRVQQVPLSGRAQGSSVSVSQSSTLNNSLQISGNVSGSISEDTATSQPLNLTLAQAVKRGLQFNLSTVAAGNAERVANAERNSARAQMMPDINGNVLAALQQTNLAAAGLRFSPISLAPGAPAFSFPSIVGPYNYFDVRATATQSVVDLTKLHNYRASKETARAASLNAQDSRELIVLAVTGSYMQLIASSSRVETARAQITTAEAAYNQAVDRNKSGLNARIDVNRTLVELQTQRQRLNSLLNDLSKQKISFARLIGLPLAQVVSLTDREPFSRNDKLPDVAETVQLAWAQRPDVRGADAQIRAAEEARRAASSEYLPSLAVSADYGVIGLNPAQSHGTFGLTGSLRFPIFRSGRIGADVEQANAVVAQRKAELQDLRGRVEQEVRNARIDLDTATEQIGLAESSRKLAAETLEQARDRFGAGLADTIELVQAQEGVTASEQDYISAMFSYQLARAGLARATGAGERGIR